MRPSDYVNGRPTVNLTEGAEMGFAYARDAAVRFAQEGERGASWVFFQGMDEEARRGFDAFLVQTQHPSAYEPGTTEHRFKMFAKEYAEACHG
jgi:hypothetical protein